MKKIFLLFLFLTFNSFATELTQVPSSMNESVIMIPGPNNTQLETTVFKPAKEGTFPVAIINHGYSPGMLTDKQRVRFYFLAKEWVQLGYAVLLPMREGFANSTGTYQDITGATCTLTELALAHANDIKSTMTYLSNQSWANNNIVVVGQSQGGLASVAVEKLTPNVKAVVNLAGGLRVAGKCNGDRDLPKAMLNLGNKTSVPMLWIYSKNDSLFPPALAQTMFTSYQSVRTEKNNIQLEMLPALNGDGHNLADNRDALPLWFPQVVSFLEKNNLPSKQIYQVNNYFNIKDSGFAKIDDLNKVPVGPNCKKMYQAFLASTGSRAFALSKKGLCAWIAGPESATDLALKKCGDSSCQIYAVDQNVVWAP